MASAAEANKDALHGDDIARVLKGDDIARVLKSSGPIVKAVLLRHMRTDGRDTKPHPASPKADETHKREVLTELIEEIEVDTTPAKSKVKEVLGGPFTFLGQYESEGTIVMVRKELPEDLRSQSVHILCELCKDSGIDTSNMLEKDDLVTALIDQQLPVNPHHLQPPFDSEVVRGDILILRVAETDEVLDKEGTNEDEPIPVPTNDEFFLDYTKEEYIAFASRTDIVAPEPPEADEEIDHEGDEEEDEEDEDYKVEEDDEEPDSEEEKRSMLNLVMGEILKKFREENGRGPDTRELLELRGQVAAQLKLEVATYDETNGDDKKRAADEGDEDHVSPKKVKFSTDDGDEKPAAAEGAMNGEDKTKES